MRSIRILLIAFLLVGVSSCGRGVAFTEPAQDLDRLVVIDRPREDGSYRRAAFGPAWADTDHNSCNQRDDALFAAVDKGRPFTIRRQHACDHDMISGTWRDPYSAQLMTFGDLKVQKQAMALPVDHIVALAVSWRYGANNWSPERRLQFATDLDNLQPTSMRINSTKSDHDAAAWRPPKGQQCRYATRYVKIKTAYALPVDPSEKQALRDMLELC